MNGPNPPNNLKNAAPRDPIHVDAIPAVHIRDNRLVVGSSQSTSTRSYTPLKVLGDGSFGTVWLCDWHGTLPPNTPLSPMQCGAGARPDWAGKRLVAVKRMKKKWEGGWDECQKLKELESLRAIPFHPNIIPLYDFFLMPSTKELYFVFESMEGNLYHLIKARKGRPLAGGLVSSIFFQIVSGLDHIHANGYFHRDMKPENVLVTTTGLFDYTTLSPVAPPNAPSEKDVVAIIKLADFGLARETKSKPPYTEYVSTRWYRAPEVLLLSRDYSNPVDMWALGTIMAELVNLRPLFPGSDQVDQVNRICEILGNPSNEYGLDCSHAPIGGGPWPRGIRMAQDVGFEFRRMPPRDIHTLFDRSVPLSLIHCIRDLLKYDPDARLTSRQCLHHPYLNETLPRNNIPLPSGVRLSTSLPYVASPSRSNGASPTSRSLHPIHSHPSSLSPSPQRLHLPNGAHSPSPSPVYQHAQPHGWPSHHANGGDYPMDISPQNETSEEYLPNGHPMDIQPDNAIDTPQPSSKLPRIMLPFGKKNSKWTLFGGDKSHHNDLPPLPENPAASSSTGSLKRTQSAGSDSRSIRGEPSSPREDPDVSRHNKKEAERVLREAEKQRRAMNEKRQRDQARAVMQKRNAIMQQKMNAKENIEWRGGSEQPRIEIMDSSIAKGKQAATGPIRREPTGYTNGTASGSLTVNAASGRYSTEPSLSSTDRKRDERMTKVRKMDIDDDLVSVSSSDVHSTGRMSSISFATVDSDPGPSGIRNRPSLFGLNRMTSTSSLRTSFDAPSARSSNSFSLDGQLAHDFRTQASMNPHTPLTGSVSPPPMQMLSLSPSLSPSISPTPPPISPTPQWMQVPQRTETLSSRRGQAPPYINVPTKHPTSRSASYSPYEANGRPPGSGHVNKTDINPIFKVSSLPTPVSAEADDAFPPSHLPPSLPPFSQLDAVAREGGYDLPPLSPTSFTTAQSEDASSS
ncbi:Pkinase-domain-containing protein [Dendrothele bispora CBS 962.96]|uniref:Pkinase-domain-containing protein n=1 Tax=Dendrothele bispora (strain CBS 962.96) TaxID=1314807 RepID=A0A4S8MQS4_DENBC|nr:Pkinase-domain-containing protein [Dendrothele bispora CBS 962.96]